MRRLHVSLGFIVFFVCILTFPATFAQDRPEQDVTTPAGDLSIKNDTARIAPTDSLITVADSVKQDSIQTPPPQGDIETTINYSARDSIRANVTNKMIWLYGDAKITYGNIEVEAEEIIIDYANNTITAQGTRDSLGNRIGYPIFKNGSELYETKGMTYNFKTRRARISEVVTQQGEGFLHSSTAFKNEQNEIFSIRNSYTTCNLEHPHFRIRATKTKAIPNDKIVAGPFYIEFNDIPLPAGFLFGMFPAQRESKSGIILPSYGEERRRGFNFRGFGYFFDISDYMKLTLTGDVYTKGGHALYAVSNYMKRYKYNGSFNFSYSKTRISELIEDNSATNDYRLTWSHSPQTKGSGRFSASVNAATSSYNQNNNMMYGSPNELYTNSLNNITAKLSSNVSYNKRFLGTPFSMGINLSHNQDLRTRLVDLSLPNLTVNMTNLYPFQRKNQTGPLDNLSIGYSMAATNRVNNNLGRMSPTARTDSIAPFTIENLPFFLDRAKRGMRHSIPISYSFKALRFFTVSPSMEYNERWYLEKLEYYYDVPTQTVITDTVEGFNRISNYSFSTSMNTRIFGMYFFNNPNSKVRAIRHIINPRISYNYTPDFSQNEDYFQLLAQPLSSTNLAVDEDAEFSQGNYVERHRGFAYGGSTLGKSSSIGFGIGNNLEMKVKTKKDTVERKVMLLNNLSISSSYNLVADSFKLNNFSIAANTNILDNTININVASTLDPYSYRLFPTTVNEDSVVFRERRTDNYVWHAGKFGRIVNATLNISTNLNPKMRDKEQQTREKVAQADISEQDKNMILSDPTAYVDFDIPWSANISYNVNYSHRVNRDPEIIQTMQMSGDISLSKAWKITYNSGFDFKSKEFTQTNFGISRDLHCWTMNLNWVPFGRFQSYNFTIRVKASVLQDLKLERRKPFFDNL